MSDNVVFLSLGETCPLRIPLLVGPINRTYPTKEKGPWLVPCTVWVAKPCRSDIGTVFGDRLGFDLLWGRRNGEQVRPFP